MNNLSAPQKHGGGKEFLDFLDNIGWRTRAKSNGPRGSPCYTQQKLHKNGTITEVKEGLDPIAVLRPGNQVGM